MKRHHNFIFLFFLSVALSPTLHAQSYPTFGNEIPVTIVGDTVPDAMEPFISPDGNYLFFNSLNNGTTTTLYYATKVNDSTFNFAGRLTGANLLTPPHLDAVASMDSANNFFWVTTRNYPSTYNNLFHGSFTGTSVIDTGRVYGNIYITTPGWIIMDACVNYNGSLLYYVNAYFNSCTAGLPCKSQLSIAQKVNDSTYNKVATSAAQLYNVDDTNYLVYAENVTKDGLELYYTRIKKTTTQTELCVAVRNTPTDTFSLPSVIYTNPAYIIEAPTLTTDKTRLYYHKKMTSNFKIYLRYRTSPSGIANLKVSDNFIIYPNPANDKITIEANSIGAPYVVKLYDAQGKLVFTGISSKEIDISTLPKGVYAITIEYNGKRLVKQIVKN
jgi:hypothetical protein